MTGIHIELQIPSEATRRQHLSPGFFAGMTIVFGSIVLAVVGPLITPFDPVTPTRDISQPPPSIQEFPSLVLSSIRGDLAQPVHWFGTDASGLDVFSRVLAAPRLDVVIGLGSTLIASVWGSFLGLFVGYFRNWGTELITRASDVMQAFPVMILAMILVVLGGGNIASLLLGIAVMYTPMFLRLTRSEVISQRERSYVEGARALGNREVSIALRHVLPNSLPPSLIQAPVIVGWAILLTASLSFVGAGVPPPTPEFGSMIASGSSTLTLGDWWPSFFPGAAISVIVLGYSLMGRWLEQRYAG